MESNKIKLSEVRELVRDILKEEKAKSCWKGYEKVGLKKGKNGKMVNDCEKIEEEETCNECNENKSKNIQKIKLSEVRKLVRKSLKESKQEYETYHDSFTSAAEDARNFAERRGFEINEEDWQTQVALGGRYGRSRPAIGKYHTFTVGLSKDGKEQRKGLTFTVYGMESGKYELVAYIN